MLTISNNVKELYPQAHFGILILKNLCNPPFDEKFNTEKLKTIENIRNSHPDYVRKEYVQSEPVKHYINYYKKFKKTYPVLLQLESIVLKNKSIPNIAALVEAMFTAEVKNMLLTAGHDLDKLNTELKLDVAQGNETFIGISGKEQSLHKNDIMLSDNTGIISSIISGPDLRTSITNDTKNALFFIYGTDGISETSIYDHLKDIENFIKLFSPDSILELIKVY